MRFSDIPGNELIKSHLINSVISGRISHAQLFSGDLGSSIFALARAYAQYIGCQKKDNKDSCGLCDSCLRYTKLIHPDLHLVFPVVTGKIKQPTSDHFIKEFRELMTANPYSSELEWYTLLGSENKQGFISVSEAFKITKKLSLKPYEGGHKVVIIWCAEKMHNTTSNKLLKILEEPPKKTLFILITSQKNQLLKTILSRTQEIKINTLSTHEIKTFLTNKKKVEKITAEKVASQASGNINKALSELKSENLSQQTIKIFQDWMRLCYQADLLKITDWVEKISEQGREQQKFFLRYALQMVQSSLIYNLTNLNIQHLRKEELDFVKKVSAFIHENNIIKLTKTLEKAHNDISRNATSKIVFNDISLKVILLLRVKSLNL